MEFKNMLTLDEMPEYRSELAGFDVSFPKLSAADTLRYQHFIKGLMQYLNSELGMCAADDITFLRGAQVAEARIWVWEFCDPSGTPFYTMVLEREGQGPVFACAPKDDLTPEQAMLAEYHACY